MQRHTILHKKNAVDAGADVDAGGTMNMIDDCFWCLMDERGTLQVYEER